MKAKVALIGTALFVIVAACGGNQAGKDSSTQATTSETVTFGTSSTGQAFYLTQVIDHFGLAKKHGLKIKVVPLALSAVATTLAGGNVDVGILTPTVALTINDQGKTPVEQIAPYLYSGNSLVVPVDSTVKSFSDLKGKKIGNFAPSTGAYFFTAVLAATDGLSLSDFKQLVGDGPAQIASLERGDIESAVLYEPYTAQMLSTGKYKVVLSFDDALEKTFGNKPIKIGLAGRTSWVKKNPDAVKKLQATVNDALTIIKEKKDEELFKQVAPADFGLKDLSVIEKAWKVNGVNYADPAPWGADIATAQTDILKKGIKIGAWDAPKNDSAFEMWGPMLAYNPDVNTN